MLTGAQLRAARALFVIDQGTLAGQAGVSLPAARRMESSPGIVRGVAGLPGTPAWWWPPPFIILGALLPRLQGILSGQPSEPYRKVSASLLPWMVHLSLVFVAGLYLPATLIAWF